MPVCCLKNPFRDLKNLTASSNPALVNEHVMGMSCYNADPDVIVGTLGGYTNLNYGPY